MAIEVPQNEEISGGGKNGGRKGVGSAIRLGGANRGGIHIKKRERGGVVDPYIIRVGIKRRKRGGRKFRKGYALPDENDNAAASVCGIKRENARPGVGAIRAQSSSIPLMNPEIVRGERRQEAQKDSQEQGTEVRGQREEIQNGQMGDRRFGDEGGAGVQH